MLELAALMHIRTRAAVLALKLCLREASPWLAGV